jgi:hypothetical protein
MSESKDMNDEQLQKLYELAQARRAGEPRGCDIAPEAMVDILTHKLPEAEHRRILLAIMANPSCRREFELLRAVSQDEGRPAGRRRTFFVPVSVAAALALLIGGGLYWKNLEGPAADPNRAAAVSEVGLVTPGPGDAAPADRRFVWRAVPGTLRYDFSLTTASGQLVYAATRPDTSLTIPDSVRVESGDLRWWVEATTGDGRQFRSAIRRLRTTSP